MNEPGFPEASLRESSRLGWGVLTSIVGLFVLRRRNVAKRTDETAVSADYQRCLLAKA